MLTGCVWVSQESRGDCRRDWDAPERSVLMECISLPYIHLTAAIQVVIQAEQNIESRHKRQKYFTDILHSQSLSANDNANMTLTRISSANIVNSSEEVVEEWQPPTESLGRVPEVKPGISEGGIPIEGDFPLDQIVIDRERVLRITRRSC